jgi:hypothetical protein
LHFEIAISVVASYQNNFFICVAEAHLSS